MPGWTLFDTHPTQGRIFYRPLDALEITFLLTSLQNGALDSLTHFQLRLSNNPKDAYLFSETNIVKAWLSTKRRFPLSGATIQGPPGAPPQRKVDSKIDEEEEQDDRIPAFAREPHFVILERDLAVLRPGEIVWGEAVASAEEMASRVADIFDGSRPLSQELLSQLYVFRETERADILHLVIFASHCVTDGTAANTFGRCLIDSLARGVESEPAQVPLEERLAMMTPSMERDPAQLRSLSPAKQRWRKAIATLILMSRVTRIKGGHTLPCRLTASTPTVPARSREIVTSITHAETATVLANCRLHNVTFGNAYLPLAQVAMTRVLYRRYLRGEISEEEWEFRKRQPYTNAGPLNLRPFLDRSWFEKGGGGEFLVSTSIFVYGLPFMTLGTTEERYRPRGQNPEFSLSDGAPPFSELLTFNRLLHRAGLVKKQAAALFSDPLMLETIRVVNDMRAFRMRMEIAQWTEHAKNADGDSTPDDEEVLAVPDFPAMPAHGGSSLGNMDSVLPLKYPLPPSHPLSPLSSVPHPLKAGYVNSPAATASGADTTPKITLVSTSHHLHSRPAELYLGASSSAGKLKLYIYYDRNVFEPEVIKEWLDEVKGAILWYLGRPAQSLVQQNRGTAGGRGGRGGEVQAKL